MNDYQITTDPITLGGAISKMTTKGIISMIQIGKGQVSFFDGGIVEGEGSWGQVLTAELGHRSSGVLNQLAKLGLFTVTTQEGEDGIAGAWWALTALGADVANTLKTVDDVPAARELARNMMAQQILEEAEPEPEPEEKPNPKSRKQKTGAASVTAKVGRMWTTLYVDGEDRYVAYLRNDQFAAISAYLAYVK